MNTSHFEFESLDVLGAAARGKPGQRTFYVYAGDRHAWARFWLEKEELQLLAAAIDEVLETVSPQAEEPPVVTDRPPEPAEPPTLEFNVGRLALLYDESKDRVGVSVYESAEAEDEDQPTLTGWASREQARAFSQRIQEVVAAGRPICSLCGGPIDPDGHICPRLNGHRDVQIH